MTPEEVKQYRQSIDTQLKEKETEIETTVTYITLGLLAFFLTINEKFVPLSNSKLKIVLILSISSFLLSFALGLLNKFMTTKFDREIIDILDGNDLAKEEEEEKLLQKWQKCDTILQKNRKLIYIFLIVGIITQVFYFLWNLKDKPIDENFLKIEILKPPSDTTLKLKNINIHIYQVTDTIKN